jgi:hypothetical protein
MQDDENKLPIQWPDIWDVLDEFLPGGQHPIGEAGDAVARDWAIAQRMIPQHSSCYLISPIYRFVGTIRLLVLPSTSHRPILVDVIPTPRVELQNVLACGAQQLLIQDALRGAPAPGSAILLHHNPTTLAVEAMPLDGDELHRGCKAFVLLLKAQRACKDLRETLNQ